eukprot:TRINITY_DN10111_c1_g1_i1.p1 TRINITY_DN10111_c1_g1~~TRINITY_DN10111_c1_g1_i1.p1  ORF type:complete len:646 (+),score=126.32 TRINITY_DN10111_c1_g1_i1:136-2073(+)
MGCGSSASQSPDKKADDKKADDKKPADRQQNTQSADQGPPANAGKAAQPAPQQEQSGTGPPFGGDKGKPAENGDPQIRVQRQSGADQKKPPPTLQVDTGSDSSPFERHLSSNLSSPSGSTGLLAAGGLQGRSHSMRRMDASRHRRKGEGDESFANLGTVLEGDMTAPQTPHRRPSAMAPQRRASVAFGAQAGGRPRRRMSSIIGDFSASVAAFLESRNRGDVTSADGQLRALFDLLNTDGEGVGLPALKDGFQKMGWAMSESWIEKMFSIADGDASGSIDWDEFQTFFKHLTDDKGDVDLVGEDDVPKVDTRLAKGSAGTRHREWPQGKRPIISHSTKMMVGHKARVKCVSVAPSMELFASCDREESTMHAFDIQSGQEMRTFVGHQDTIMCVVISPDRKHMATASRDGNLIIWDVAVGYSMRELEHPGVITCCAFSPDGKMIYTGCQDNVVRKFSVSKGRLLRVADRLPAAEKGVIVSVCCQPGDGAYVALSRSRDSCLLVIDANTFRLVHQLMGHSAMIWACTFSPCGAYIVSNCECAVRVWNVASGGCVNQWGIDDKRLQLAQVSRSRCVIWTTCTYCPHDFGHFIAAVSSDNVIFFVHHLEGHVALVINTHAPVYCMSASRDRNLLCCGDENGNLYRVELR